MITTEEAIKKYKFKDEYELYKWSQTFELSYIYDEDGYGCLYTDGDGGIAEITFSEIYEEHGVDIQLIDCAYCSFDMETLNHIHDAVTILAIEEYENARH